MPYTIYIRLRTLTNNQIDHSFTHDKEEYVYASTPTPTSQHELNTYYNTCWVS